MIKKDQYSFLIGVICFLIFSIVSCSPKKFRPAREFIDLSGDWQFQTDTGSNGIAEKWFTKKLNDSIILPGTMEENKKGLPNTDTNEYSLNRDYIFAGKAWYRKIIEIPDAWNNKHISLILERTKPSQVWIDSTPIGFNNSIFTKQVYEFPEQIIPGTHIITILVDNTPELLPIKGSHANSDDTQTNWNGIIGKIGIEASERTRIEGVKSFSDISKSQIVFKTNFKHSGKAIKGARVCIKTSEQNYKHRNSIPDQWFILPEISSDTIIEFTFKMLDKTQFWSEFNPVFYKFSIELYVKNVLIDNQIFSAGMREFKTIGTQFNINGLTTFLRGKNDACVFPLTGYPAMDVDGWLKVFKIAKEYGINHYRFHTWTPPEAAFEAADIAGIYLQPELPIWYGFNANDSAQMDLMMMYGKEILDNYGNHPSFVMFALGNEIGEDREKLKSMISNLRDYDSRLLYAQGSNNRNWVPSYAKGDDYWTTFRTGKETYDLSTDVRSSNSHFDAKEGGILNTFYPNTTFTYKNAIAHSPVPIIGHEIGQYQIYPSYATEIPKYTGILKPRNLEFYKNRLDLAGMGDQADAFFRESGSLAIICYKAEIETAIRTKGFGGFQMLDLQDYPGQGTALVGMLDVFMDSKGLIAPEEFREFCNRVVVLCKMERYCWTAGENFLGEIDVANYGPNDLTDKTITWQLVSEKDNDVFAKGEYNISTIKQGILENIGSVSLKLPAVEKATKLILKMELGRKVAKNEYPIWVYPMAKDTITVQNFMVASAINYSVEAKLKQGGTVLLIPKLVEIQKNSVAGQFIPEFWNYKMFTEMAIKLSKPISPGTLGILTDPNHPLFTNFPTESHSNWQWWIITKNSRPVILDETEKIYRPLVQVIDNINRNHKLGMLFEFKCGKGKILVCAVDLAAIANKPEGRQFKEAIYDYVSSEEFNPATEIPIGELRRLIFE